MHTRVDENVWIYILVYVERQSIANVRWREMVVTFKRRRRRRRNRKKYTNVKIETAQHANPELS